MMFTEVELQWLVTSSDSEAMSMPGMTHTSLALPTLRDQVELGGPHAIILYHGTHVPE